MIKETAASYKLDFKYTPDPSVGLKQKSYTISSFNRVKRYWKRYSEFDGEVLRYLGKEKDYYYDSPMQIADYCRCVNESVYMQHAEEAFHKWLKRRQPIINAWNDWLEYVNSPTTPLYERSNNPPSADTPITLQHIADLIHNSKFRSILETSRPYVMPIGSAVKLKDDLKNVWRVDPLYYDREYRNSSRIGVIIKYDDYARGKGVGTRYVEVMMFCNGQKYKFQERHLELYTQEGD